MQNQYFTYIATNKRNTVFYTGISGDLFRRINEHKSGSIKGFTKKYNINKLVHFEVFNNPREAILREKQIKEGSRQDKIDLIQENNPDFKDLAE
ncbi:MAG: Excinuclease ABC C subunit domain protein [Parcubacteria group bacterium GW2011_GWC1_43_12]|nr:MAG: Excinuclease ABC C subunit domain protein [Parcubacteria group bacterium GW2011_GWC1_43_12]